ncbi:unnamed protein product [Haemonchus placei]|uniref:Metalloendopeptidase n=1 Tax=Haemonchus placei TaxID=6290 RepID=A0A0N4WJX4_HAEPC|nr:unnamed protein product [Haemonchus placei]
MCFFQSAPILDPSALLVPASARTSLIEAKEAVKQLNAKGNGIGPENEAEATFVLDFVTNGGATPPPSEATDEYLREGVTTPASEHIEASVNPIRRQKRQIDRRATRWVENKVFYYFDPSVEEKAQKIVRKALSYISARTCIDFHEDLSATNRIRINKGKICFSYVGMQGGEQDLFLNKACCTVGSVVHEFMHALGVWHMQMRDDRDHYIRVDLSSVPVINFFVHIVYKKKLHQECSELSEYEAENF